MNPSPKAPAQLRLSSTSGVLRLLATTLLLAGPNPQVSAQTSLTAIGRDGENSRITFLDSVPGSSYQTPASGLQVWCVNAGVAGAAYYAGTHPDSPALTYRVVDFSTVSANASDYYDSKGYWPEYPADADTFGRWAEAAFEYSYTHMETFSTLISADGYQFERHFMQSIVSEIAHEGPTTFGVTIDSNSGRGNIFGAENQEARLVDAYFSWMLTGTATLDGYTWINSGPLYTDSYDNPDIAVIYLDRNHNEPDFEFTQDYIAFVPIPEPSAALLFSAAGLIAGFRRRRRD